MKSFDFGKHSSSLKQRMRDVFRKRETAEAFKTSQTYSHTLKTTLELLRLQEEQFADFVIRKQKEIDKMEPCIIKYKMQEHLNKIAQHTYEHFSKLTYKYQLMLKAENDEGAQN